MKKPTQSTPFNILGLYKLTFRKVVNDIFSSFILCILFLYIGQSVFGDQARTVKSIIIREKNTFSTPDEKQILQLMQTKVGSDFDDSVLNEDLSTIVRYFKNKGFTYVRIDKTDETVKLVENEIHIGIVIDKGVIGEITLEGNRKTHDDVILQELLFKIGEIYTKDDREESERIIRQKRYISDANIDSFWDEELEVVKIHVSVSEDWSITGAIDVPIGRNSSTFLLNVQETNLNGTGHGTQLRYERINEVDEQARSYFKWQYEMPRLFSSYWNFDGEYIQKREGDSWVVSLERPQYTLKSRWSTRFVLAEGVDQVRWYESGEKTATFNRNVQIGSGDMMRYFGERHQQIYTGLWMRSQRSRYVAVDRLDDTTAAPLDRNINRIGITVGRKRVYHRKTRFLKKMGPVEDFNTGAEYNVSYGYASPWYGSDRRESILGTAVRSGWTIGEKFISESIVGVSSIFTDRFERSVLQVHSTLFFKDTFNSGDDIYTVSKGYRKNGLFDFYHSFVIQFKSEMQFGLSGESQVILGSFSGLRGYDYRQFSGEKMMLLRLESRTIFGGAIFEKIDDAVAAVVTFIASPFVKGPIRLGVVLGGTLFTDIGYIWNGTNTFDIREPKRSVGLELRGGLSRVSNAGIFRLELAFPLDPPFTPSLKPKFDFGFMRAF